MEDMFSMLQEIPDIKDSEDAQQFDLDKGEISFEKVSFEYIKGFVIWYFCSILNNIPYIDLNTFSCVYFIHKFEPI